MRQKSQMDQSSETSLELLYEISRQLVSTLDLKQVLSRVLVHSADYVGAERGMLIVLDDDMKPREAAIVYQGRLLPYMRRDLDGILLDGLAGWVLRNQKIALVPDTSQDERWLHRPDDDPEQSGPKSAICAPVMMAEERLVGVITLVHPEPHFFSQRHVALLQAVADQAAIAIFNARLYQSLEAAHLRYRELFEDSVDSILITDWSGYIVEANRMAGYISGYEVFNLIQRKITDLHRANWDLLGEGFQFLKSGVRTVKYESELYCREEGHLIPIQVYAHKVTINGTDQIQWFFRDISERKELETLQDELFAMIYHDLRSPLANVVSSLDLIKSMIPKDDAAMLEPVLNIALRSTERVKRLANSLLDIHRLEAGQKLTDLTEVRLQRLVSEALDTIAPNVEAKQLSVKNQIPDGLPSLFVDNDMIRRVLINLLENAVKFTPTNGEIVISAEPGDNELLIRVEDTGSGIPAEARERIFDKFTRLKVENAPRGIGLGLAFCRLAIEAHGGKIWVEPRQPIGSRFIFTLPFLSPKSRAVS